MIEQALPITVIGRWKTGGKYPDSVWVEMSDGQRVAYDLRIRQPEPKLDRDEDMIGYGYSRRRVNRNG